MDFGVQSITVIHQRNTSSYYNNYSVELQDILICRSSAADRTDEDLQIELSWYGRQFAAICCKNTSQVSSNQLLVTRTWHPSLPVTQAILLPKGMGFYKTQSCCLIPNLRCSTQVLCASDYILADRSLAHGWMLYGVIPWTTDGWWEHPCLCEPLTWNLQLLSSWMQVDNLPTHGLSYWLSEGRHLHHAVANNSICCISEMCGICKIPNYYNNVTIYKSFQL